MKRRSRDRGATFLGVLIATVIIALAILPMMSTLIDQTQKTTMSRDRIFATHLANSVIERLRLEKYSQVKLYCSSIEAGEAFINEDKWLNPEDAPAKYKRMVTRFRRMAIVEELRDRAGKLEVIVTWTEDGNARQVSVCTILVDDFFPGGKP